MRYSCRGNVRPDCGIEHRTLTGAARCLHKDQVQCERWGGYSDREIVDLETGEIYGIDRRGRKVFRVDGDGVDIEY